MNETMIDAVKAVIAEKFAPAVNFNAPYAKLMVDAAARAAAELVFLESARVAAETLTEWKASPDTIEEVSARLLASVK